MFPSNNYEKTNKDLHVVLRCSDVCASWWSFPAGTQQTGREGAGRGKWPPGLGEKAGLDLDFWPRAEHSGRASLPEISLDKGQGLACIFQDIAPIAWEWVAVSFTLYTFRF